jgi:hypothetical protein
MLATFPLFLFTKKEKIQLGRLDVTYLNYYIKEWKYFNIEDFVS